MIGNQIIRFANIWWAGDFNYIAENITDIEILSDEQLKLILTSISNLEILRKFRDRLGLEKYIKLMSLEKIHSEIDSCGNPMNLYKVDETNNYTILLEVVCPSTKRVYYIYPPNQSAKTCSEAKESTFTKKIKYRHGDVGLHSKIDENDLEIET